MGGLREGEVPRTGQVQRIAFNEKGRKSAGNQCSATWASGSGTCGKAWTAAYILTGEAKGALLRIEPAGSPGAEALMSYIHSRR